MYMSQSNLESAVIQKIGHVDCKGASLFVMRWHILSHHQKIPVNRYC